MYHSPMFYLYICIWCSFFVLCIYSTWDMSGYFIWNWHDFSNGLRISLVTEQRRRGHKPKLVNALCSRCSVTREIFAVRKQCQYVPYCFKINRLSMVPIILNQEILLTSLCRFQELGLPCWRTSPLPQPSSWYWVRTPPAILLPRTRVSSRFLSYAYETNCAKVIQDLLKHCCSKQFFKELLNLMFEL
jgi:hypothetical protein